MRTLYDNVSEAAMDAWRATDDDAMRELVVTLESCLLHAGFQTAASLGRLADASEAGGDEQTALDAWRLLLAGADTASDEWYEARYQSLRLLSRVDPARAREAMDQHVVLHPSYGPEPWGERLRELDEALPRAHEPDGSEQ